jgi:serine/threonine protein kinase
LHFHHEYYTESVDIWALGILTLFLLNSDPIQQLAGLKSMDQETIDAMITKIFASVSLQEALCLDGQSFVRHCLKVKPELRMTAKQAKRHPWLRLSRRKIDDWTKIRDASWKPKSRSSPLITDLMDIQDLKASVKASEDLELVNKATSSCLTPSCLKKKRNTGADQLNSNQDTEKSPYFQHMAPGPSKKLKANVTDGKGLAI